MTLSSETLCALEIRDGEPTLDIRPRGDLEEASSDENLCSNSEDGYPTIK
jgi:hypothetical protein